MSVRKNMASLLLSQLATWAVTLILLVLAPDRLGELGFGTLTYATAFVAFFGLVAGLGTGTLMTREIARHPALLRSYVHNAVLLKSVVLVALVAIALLVAVVLGNRGETLILIAVGLVGMAMGTYNEIWQSALAGLEIMAKPAALGVIAVYTASILGILALTLDWGLIVYASVFALSAAIPFVGNRLVLRPYLRGERAPTDFDVWRFLVRAGIPLMALAFFNLIYGTLDIPILEFISGKGAVAQYGLAYRWVGIPIFIAAAVVGAYYPRFSAHARDQPEEFARLVNRAIRLVLLVSVPAAFGLAMVADNLINFFYSASFEPAIPLIQILALHIPIAAMDTILAVALIASDRHRKYILVSVAAAIVNPVACVLLIKWAEREFDNGAIGAAIVTFGTELFVMCGALMLRSRGVLDGAAIQSCARIIVAGAVLVPVLVVAQDLLLPLQVVLGVVVYAVSALVTRATTIAEVRGIVNDTMEAVRSRRRSVAEPVK